MRATAVLATFSVAIAAIANDPERSFPTLAPSLWWESFNYSSLASLPWKPLKIKKAHDKRKKVYDGEWKLEEPYKYPSENATKGLVLKTKAAHHGISRWFDEPFTVDDDHPLVVQYEVKLQTGLDCGGAYLKLLDYNATDAQPQFSSATKYQVMFGPDRCGSNNKVHFILNRKSPVTGVSSEKHLVEPPMARYNLLTNLYTLIVDGDHYEIRINGNVAKAGRLTEEGTFSPLLNPPEEIVDEKDFKPLDWDDREYIPDPDQTNKPDWWEEKHGRVYIPDPNETMPADWLVDELPYIEIERDQPEDWDVDRDGEWEGMRLVVNPKCREVSGCGPWAAKKIPNPDYKAKWIQPDVKNPNYKGEWQPRNITNPKYYNDTHPWRLLPIGGIGFDLWSMNPDILFDNIYLGHSVEEAEAIGNLTFLPKFHQELADKKLRVAEEEAEVKPALPPPPLMEELMEQEDHRPKSNNFVVKFLRHHLSEVEEIAKGLFLKPIPTIFADPVKIIIYFCVFVVLFSIGFGVVMALIFVVTGIVPDGPPPESLTQQVVNQAVDADARRDADAKAVEDTTKQVVEIIEQDEDAVGVKETEAEALAKTSTTTATKRRGHTDETL